MKKIIALILLASVTALIGCSDKKEVGRTYGEESLTFYDILFTLDGVDAGNEKYYINFVRPGTLENDSCNTATPRMGPLYFDRNGEYRLDLNYNFELIELLDGDTSVQVVVTTEEDIHMHNPLNAETIVQLVKNDNKDTVKAYKYLSKVAAMSISATDKYPDGVLSLHTPNAVFAIKLHLDESLDGLDSYTLVMTDNDGNIVYSGEPLLSHYYECAFNAEDVPTSTEVTVTIKDFVTGEIIKYRDYPLSLTFDANGKCAQGDIITVYIDNDVTDYSESAGTVG